MSTSHHAVLIVFWTVLGACLGSFLNVCAYRIPRGLSVRRPRSRCPQCGASILARDNVPVLGWVLLRGRCRECRCGISPRYAAVELATALLFAAPYLCALALAPGDPWERIGAGRLLGILLASWTATSVGVYLVIAGREAQWSPSAARSPAPRRVGAGSASPVSSVPRLRGDRG